MRGKTLRRFESKQTWRGIGNEVLKYVMAGVNVPLFPYATDITEPLCGDGVYKIPYATLWTTTNGDVPS